jgi:cell cycle sensor histidine kinase DivJ
MSLINDLLDLSKIEAGKVDLTFESVPVNSLIQECVALMQPLANRERIIIRTSLATQLPNVVADMRSLRQILLNLLSNAIKFTDRGGSVTLSARREGERLALTVSDDGIGIAENDLERLGHPFFQARSSYDRPYEGTGLGLSVVKGLVELHGGRVEIGSRLGEGTRVTVHLPLDCERAATRRPPVVEALPERAPVVEPIKVKKSA